MVQWEVFSRKKSLPPNKRIWSATANEDSQNEVITLHKDYIRAGADIITTNTFRTNPYSLISSGITDIVGNVSNAVDLAKRARENLLFLLLVLILRSKIVIRLKEQFHKKIWNGITKFILMP